MLGTFGACVQDNKLNCECQTGCFSPSKAMGIDRERMLLKFARFYCTSKRSDKLQAEVGQQ